MKKLNSKIKSCLAMMSLMVLVIPVITLSAVACFPNDINSIIKINTQPQNKTAIIGQKENLPIFSVGVNHVNNIKFSYQWYSNTTNSNTNGTLINGATSSSYTVTTEEASVVETTYYYVNISSLEGNNQLKSTTSKTASLTIIKIPEIRISTQPEDTVAFVNQIHNLPTFSVDVYNIESAQLKYQWYSNINDSNKNGIKIDGATADSYKIPQTDVANTGTKYFYVEISGSINGIKLVPIYSKIASFTTKTLPMIIVKTQPENQTVSEDRINDLPIFSVSISEIKGALLTYQWYSNTVSSTSNGIALIGATSSSYKVTSADITLTPKYFYVKVNGSINGVDLKPIYSKVVSLTKVVNPKVVQQAVNKQTQFIYKHETPVLFTLVPAKTGAQSTLKMSGTAWVFDVANYTNSNPLLRTYYLATNHHVIDFTKSILNSIAITTQNIKDGKQKLGPNSYPYGTDASNLKFFVKMMLPKYQFGTNPKQSLTQENVDSSANYYNFSTRTKNLVFSSNYLFYNGQTEQYNSSNDSIFQSLPTGNFNFTVNNLTWTNVIDKLNLKNRAADADIGFIQLSFNQNATDNDIPNVIKNFNSYYLNQNNYINPFAINPIPFNNKYYIGGFPGAEGRPDLRWVSPSSTITSENPSGNISVNSPNPTYFPIRNANGQTVNAFAYDQKQDYLGAYTYLFPGLNLNHGSSGSMVTNAEHQIIGIYWGGIQTTNLINNKLSFKGAVISFSENQIIPIWNQYYKQFLASTIQGTTTNFLAYFASKTDFQS